MTEDKENIGNYQYISQSNYLHQSLVRQQLLNAILFGSFFGGFIGTFLIAISNKILYPIFVRFKFSNEDDYHKSFEFIQYIGCFLVGIFCVCCLCLYEDVIKEKFQDKKKRYFSFVAIFLFISFITYIILPGIRVAFVAGNTLQSDAISFPISYSIICALIAVIIEFFMTPPNSSDKQSNSATENKNGDYTHINVGHTGNIQIKSPFAKAEILINKLPSSPDPNHPGIKELLEKLKTAIVSEPDLSDEDKNDALKHIGTLAEQAGKKSQDETIKTPAKTAIQALKGIFSDLPDIAKLAEAGKTLIPIIAKMFGVS
ncbi:hypothetical protein [Dolichospermum circinale]|uniref:hypothetical protein n=1 Tax=Dolichospermum circinale TaxID=109265 RepID=UPI00232E17CC|nr:hypothetical protein [Dolichospermum circinale]MDB9548078.1 hypothetical protein [Dolichospermum circinale CS-1031]